MFQGSMVALVTPMNADLSVDYDALGNLIEFHLAKGTQAIVAVGTTGESATLSHEEHRQVIHFTLDVVNKRVPVIAGTGSNSTTEAIELTAYAKTAGADGVLLVSPYYNKPTQEGLYLHHQAIAKAVSIPQILYNVPGRTAVDMKTETVARLSQLDNIVGIKEATGDISRVREILAQCKPGFALYTGDDATAVDFLLAGGLGGISVTANVAPQTLRQVYDLALAGDSRQAHALDSTLLGLHKYLFCEANPIPVKWALAQMGLIQPYIRLPLTPLAEFCQADLRQAMQQAGVLS